MPTRKGFGLNCWFTACQQKYMAVQQGKAGGRCLKTKLTHFRLMKEKYHQSSPPLAPQFQGGEASFKPENNGATFPSFLLAKVTDLVEVSTLGKALNKKPHANKASPCAISMHFPTSIIPACWQHQEFFPLLCKSLTRGNGTAVLAWKDISSAGLCAPHMWWGRSAGLVFLSRGLPLSPSLPASPALPNVQDSRQRLRHRRQTLSKIRRTD